MHWMLNVSAWPEGVGAGVLLRAAVPLAGLEEMRVLRTKARCDEDLLSGPGKLAAAFGIDASAGGTDLFAGGELRLEPGDPPIRVLYGPRIGISTGQEHEWRFVDGEALPFVSVKTGLRPR